VPSTGDGFRQTTGTSSAASSWNATDTPAPICGADKQLEGDHVVPLSRGGSNALVNLATACRPCNLSKGSKTVEEWGARELIRQRP